MARIVGKEHFTFVSAKAYLWRAVVPKACCCPRVYGCVEMGFSDGRVFSETLCLRILSAVF